MQTTSDHAIGTARPKADEQWHSLLDFERDAGPPVLWATPRGPQRKGISTLQRCGRRSAYPNHSAPNQFDTSHFPGILNSRSEDHKFDCNGNIVPTHSALDELAFRFFREFARCEYALKAVGLRKRKKDQQNHHNPEADWEAFAGEVQPILEAGPSTELNAAVQYYLQHPPKRQIVTNGELDWDNILPNHQNQAQLVLLLICRVRNNLFHGGKFNGHWFAPQRSNELMEHALVILRACIASHVRVKDAYDHQPQRGE